MEHGCPDCTFILPSDADRDDWLDARREGIGSSDASTIAGVNPYSTLYELWLDKTGRGFEQPYTAEMRFGHLIEDDARQVFTEDTGIDVTVPGLARSNTRSWQQCTVDGLTSDGGVLEIKSVGWRLAHLWDDEQVADHAEVQVQWAMDVTGRRHAWVVAVIEREFVFRRVEYDPALAATVRAMGSEFWHENVLGDEEPALVAADLNVVKRRNPAATSGRVKASQTSWLDDTLTAYAEAKMAVKTAEEEKDRIEAELIDYIGDAESAGTIDDDGDILITVTRKNITRNGFDTASLREAHPDLYEQYATTTTHRRLSVLARPRKAT